MPEKTRKPTGPMGRTFNRILQVRENRSDTQDMAFNREQLKEFLDNGLQLAEGEWFRGAKLDGVTDALMERLDLDATGTVSWEEFQEFERSVVDVIAPALAENPTAAQVELAASGTFAQADTSGDGQLTLEELQASTRESLPEGTDHADLIAQLGARMAVDGVDQDQREQKVARRRLSRTEWIQAAKQLTGLQ
ncbi:MAG: hypothetical protein VX899_15850 [Myxococcota bacterium]|nr:hypothetical protein [Myxococcota bacterium]